MWSRSRQGISDGFSGHLRRNGRMTVSCPKTVVRLSWWYGVPSGGASEAPCPLDAGEQISHCTCLQRLPLAPFCLRGRTSIPRYIILYSNKTTLTYTLQGSCCPLNNMPSLSSPIPLTPLTSIQLSTPGFFSNDKSTLSTPRLATALVVLKR